MNVFLRATQKVYRACSFSTRLRSTDGTESVAVPLSYATFQSTHGAPEPQKSPLVILHGLFGCKRNWESLAKAFSRSGRKVITVDARNHGDSPHAAEMDYEVMAADLELLLRHLKLDKATFLGHSMGGKVAMTFALTRPLMVDQLIIEDVSPSESGSTVTDFLQIVKKIRQLAFDSSVTSLVQARRHAHSQLEAVIPGRYMRDFIITNLEQHNGDFAWRVNMEAIESYLPQIMAFPDFSNCFYGDTIFIGGTKSNYIRPETIPDIMWLFPEAVVDYIEGAGHWVHADKPWPFLDRVQKFLNPIAPVT